MSTPPARDQGRLRALATQLASPHYEVLPLPTVLEQTAALPEHTVVTVTASSRHGIGATVELCEKLAAQRLRAVPHLAARQVSGHAELRDMLDRLAASGVDDVFVIAGDTAEPAGPFADGLALLRAMADLDRLPATVGVPSYPEGHPLLDEGTLWSALRAKQDYASYTVTQLCFDADTVGGFAAAAAAHGITLPIVVGVPGVVDAATLLRVGTRIGVGESLRFVRGHRSLAGRLLRPGTGPEAVVRKLGSLARQGRCTPSGLHFYTFNKVGATARWIGAAHRMVA